MKNKKPRSKDFSQAINSLHEMIITVDRNSRELATTNNDVFYRYLKMKGDIEKFGKFLAEDIKEQMEKEKNEQKKSNTNNKLRNKSSVSKSADKV